MKKQLQKLQRNTINDLNPGMFTKIMSVHLCVSKLNSQNACGILIPQLLHNCPFIRLEVLKNLKLIVFYNSLTPAHACGTASNPPQMSL